MKKVLLTGYSGFIGKHLVSKLKDTYLLTGLGRTPSLDLEYVKTEISASTYYEQVLNGIDVVIHAAARVQVMGDNAIDSLSEFRGINRDGTLNLAKQAAKAGVKRFIFISTIKVNGESTSNKEAFTAKDAPLPQDSYGVSKAEAEKELLALGQQGEMEVVIIRPPLVYGAGVKANFSALMKLVKKGIPLPFHLIKYNQRSLVSVYNLVDLIGVCITHPKAANKIFLVSDDHDLSTAEMVVLMAKVQSKRNIALPIPNWCFKVVGNILNKNDVIERLTGSLQLNITDTKNTLNWQPPYSIEYGFLQAAKSISMDKT
ncbi:SDR family oxidoreductase [Psychromonas sp. SP041]|uniref:UDP-glucose 4-epimerase family protein n=1 Tax=Psychromonas sp. SP041 TaxID=1365007 RepID=UPI0004067EB5|nr:SDR family oxidoreductase [Psychromonas sp. SP041]